MEHTTSKDSLSYQTCKPQRHREYLYSEISNKINILLKKDLKKLSVSMEKYDKILIWIKE